MLSFGSEMYANNETTALNSMDELSSQPRYQPHMNYLTTKTNTDTEINDSIPGSSTTTIAQCNRSRKQWIMMQRFISIIVAAVVGRSTVTMLSFRPNHYSSYFFNLDQNDDHPVPTYLSASTTMNDSNAKNTPLLVEGRLSRWTQRNTTTRVIPMNHTPSHDHNHSDIFIGDGNDAKKSMKHPTGHDDSKMSTNTSSLVSPSTILSLRQSMTNGTTGREEQKIESPIKVNLTTYNSSTNTTTGTEPTIIGTTRNASISLSSSSSSSVSLLSLSRLPDWFREYSSWHTSIVQNLTIDNYNNYQYLIITCMNHTKCYGTSDRLKMIPVFVKLAAKSRRVLFIYWSKPYPIEEFLVPNTVYMNWTVPSSIYQSLLLRDANNIDNIQFPVWKLGQHYKEGMNDAASMNQPIIRIQHCTYAADWYNKNRENNTILIANNNTSTTTTTQKLELSMWEVYHEFWNAMFLPSRGVYNELVATLQRLNLLYDRDSNLVIYYNNSSNTDEDSTGLILPASDTSRNGVNWMMRMTILRESIKPYISVHVRANYVGDNSNNTYQSIINPINCGYQLQQQYRKSKQSQAQRTQEERHQQQQDLSEEELPIYIASDTRSVIDRAIQYGQERYSLRVVSSISKDDSNKTTNTSTNTFENPYHIDQTIPTSTTIPNDYYPTFIDLYLLSFGSCYTWGVGGYGSWASAIGSTTIAQQFCPSTIVHTKRKC